MHRWEVIPVTQQERWDLEAELDTAIHKMNEAALDPDATEDEWLKRKHEVDEIQRTLTGTPRTLAGIWSLPRTPGRVL